MVRYVLLSTYKWLSLSIAILRSKCAKQMLSQAKISKSPQHPRGIPGDVENYPRGPWPPARPAKNYQKTIGPDRSIQQVPAKTIIPTAPGPKNYQKTIEKLSKNYQNYQKTIQKLSRNHTDENSGRASSPKTIPGAPGDAAPIPKLSNNGSKITPTFQSGKSIFHPELKLNEDFGRWLRK